MRRYLLVIGLLFAFAGSRAQIADTVNNHRSKTDSLNAKRDSVSSKPFVPKQKKVKVFRPDSLHSPRLAVFRSLKIPGWGQIYNRNGAWWKVPAIYGGLGALAYNIYTNGVDYNKFLKESQWRSQGRQSDPNSPTYTDVNGNIIPSGEPQPYYQGSPIANISDQTIYDYKDNLRRNRDLSIFGFVLVWGVQAIEAYVEAKFIHSYSMDNDLSFKLEPQINNMPVYASTFNTTFTPGLKLTLFLK